VYFIYGVHWCLNAVTREEGFGSAVLIRALEPVDGITLMRERRGVPRDRDLTNGPGKLCQALAITGAQDGLSLASPELSIRSGAPVPDDSVAVTPRIGITKAADWPLRWIVRESPFVSRRP
jgi:DNA-3-methyladenine glycosylase